MLIDMAMFAVYAAGRKTPFGSIKWGNSDCMAIFHFSGR